MIKNKLSSNNMLNGNGFFSGKKLRPPIRLRSQPTRILLNKPTINPVIQNVNLPKTKDLSFDGLIKEGSTGDVLNNIAKSKVDGISVNKTQRWGGFLKKEKKSRGCGCGGAR